MKAGFIIVGVMKSGTTTLAHLLHQHPAIAIPHNEVHFFDYDWNYAKGIAWYEAKMQGCVSERTVIAGEKTPYSFYPYTAERIAQYDPAMKLIWIFRNPVDRAYSNYNHDLYNIDEWRSFERCIALEEKRDLLYKYLYKGRYSEQVKNFLKFFPREKMLFVTLEDLQENTQAELARVLEFLGVPMGDYQFKTEHSKKSRQPAHPATLYFYRKFMGRKGRIWNFLWRKSFEGNIARKMKPETRQKLLAYYEPLNAELAQLTGLDLSKWNK